MVKNAASIVIPLLRQRDEWLRQCVTSALEQTVPCDVVVVVSPKTEESNLVVLDGLRSGNNRLAVIREGPGRGFAAAINAGIRAAATARLGLLLSDDWLERSAVEECLKFSSDIVSTGAIIYDTDGARKTNDPRSMQKYMEKSSLEAKASYLEHFFLFNRSKLLAVGGVDESIGPTGADDYDLIWTLLENGATVSIVEKNLYHYRDHSGERLTLRSKEEQVADLRKILEKHGVRDSEKGNLIENYAEWYGEPIHTVLDRLALKASTGR